MPSDAPLYETVVRYLRSGIDGRALRPGDRLPTQRHLAQQLGVSVPTVARGFLEAQRQGIIISKVGSGTFVAVPSGAHAPRIVQRADYLVNCPSKQVLHEVLDDDVRAFFNEQGGDALFSYTNSEDSQAAGKAISTWLSETGVHLPGIPVLCEGAHHGIYLALQASCSANDVVVCDELTYPGLFAIAAALDLRLVTARVDKDGAMPDEVDRCARDMQAKALFLNPTLQNPLGFTMPLRRREELARVAELRNLIIIEDDVYRALAREVPPPVASLAPHRTYYIGSVSKSLAPGLRLGFVVTSLDREPEIRSLARAHRYLGSAHAQRLVARWVGAGLHRKVVDAHRREIASRGALAQEILQLKTPVDSYHVWLPLPPGVNDVSAAGELALQAVDVASSSTFSGPLGTSQSGIRLALGAFDDLELMQRSLLIIRKTIFDREPARHFHV